MSRETLEVELVDRHGAVELGERDERDSGRASGADSTVPRVDGRDGRCARPRVKPRRAASAGRRARRASRPASSSTPISREVRVGSLGERRADALAAAGRVDGDRRAVRGSGRSATRLVRRRAPSRRLVACSSHASIALHVRARGRARGIVAHALRGDDRLRPCALTHRGGARHVVERSFPDHAGNPMRATYEATAETGMGPDSAAGRG